MSLDDLKKNHKDNDVPTTPHHPNAQKVNPHASPVKPDGAEHKKDGITTAPENIPQVAVQPVPGNVNAHVDITQPQPIDTSSNNKDEHLYATPTSESFSVQLPSGEIKAKDGLLRLNSKQRKELEDLIATGRPDISQNVLYVDVKAAEKRAREHIESRKAEAHRGGVHSGANAERTSSNLSDVNLDTKVVPEGAPASMAIRAATAEAQREANGQPLDEDEAKRRALAMGAQATRVLIPVEEQVMHADDTGLKQG